MFSGNNKKRKQQRGAVPVRRAQTPPIESEENAVDLFAGMKGASSEEQIREAEKEARFREAMDRRREEAYREEMELYAIRKKTWQQQEAERQAKKRAEEEAKKREVLPSYFQNTDSDLFNTATKDIIAASVTDQDQGEGQTSTYQEMEEAVSLEEMIPARVAASKASFVGELFDEKKEEAKSSPASRESKKEGKKEEKAGSGSEGRKGEKRSKNTGEAKEGVDKRKIAILALLALFAFLFIFSACKLIGILHTYRHAARTNKEVQQIFHASLAEPNRTVDDSVKEADRVKTEEAEKEDYAYTSFSLDPLIAINPDTVAWLTIPGASVDHVVVQCSNDSFYLWRDFYEEENDCGTLFMDCENVIGEPLQNLVIYGHRMRDGSMFAHLDVFLDQIFVNENPTFTIYMADGEYECQIFAAYRTTTDFNYYQTFFADEEEMMDFVQRCVDHSEVATQTTLSPEDTILTLSTCDRATDKDKGRLVIQAKMVKVHDSEGAAGSRP